MDISITGRNVGITDRFRAYAEEKSAKIDALADRAVAFEVRVSRHHEKSSGASGDDRVELTLIGPGPLIRAESTASDKYAAFDLAFARIAERLRRAKDRKKVHRGRHRPTSVAEAAGDGFATMDVVPADGTLIETVATGSLPVVTDEAQAADEDAYNPVVIRTKVFASSPMTVDDALYYMELVGHDFYLFIDAETERPSVVYRRKGWDYGVIALDDAAPVQQEAATVERAGVTV
ncbi:ribosome-associated translation inhibitor RaiA [Curtobacterium sp. MCBD17_013]|uniref:ribosome hibernation-promoting factor, HPF/YfiA family n=1 Tax=unclassified Curtobacterium TaxID=257496 RepID=UPI000DA93A81|nr:MULTISPECIES: ribosome-associated translation inhibitor RaiA [unclassified Curtobacterium]PZF64462.1 ribosome-associated translation inhibitor RaiA [Curtobacterium sp. MCBD17_013]WIB62540.1 ribosome-associated translation inhibitor RaiA [Curtobacterium sp. MCBD17_040]